MGEGQRVKRFKHVAELDRVRLQKLAPGRYVKKEVVQRDGSADGAGTGAAALVVAARAAKFNTHLIVGGSRAKLELTHGGHRREGFPAKPHGGQGEEVVGLPKL